jgi:hypothetical protein
MLLQFSSKPKMLFARHFSTREIIPTHTITNVFDSSLYVTSHYVNNSLHVYVTWIQIYNLKSVMNLKNE